MFKWLINLFKKEKNMARPRTIVLEQGEIQLHGFPKEVADSISEHIKNFGTNKSSEANGGYISVDRDEAVAKNKDIISNLSLPKNNPISLPNKALGVIIKNEFGKSQLVTVAYNADTGEARVDNIVTTEGYWDSSLKFKMASLDLGFIK